MLELEIDSQIHINTFSQSSSDGDEIKGLWGLRKTVVTHMWLKYSYVITCDIILLTETFSDVPANDVMLGLCCFLPTFSL